MLTTLVLLLTILPFMAQNIEPKLPVPKKVNRISPISIEDNRKSAVTNQESNMLGLLVEQSSPVTEEHIFSSRIEEHHGMRTERYDETYVETGDIYGTLKPIGYKKFQVQKEDANMQQQTVFYEKILMESDEQTEETLKLDRPTVESKFYAGSEKILNSHMQVRKNNDLNMYSDNNDIQLNSKDLQFKQILKEASGPVDSRKGYISEEIERNLPTEAKAKEKLSIKKEEITELYRPTELINTQTKENTKLLEKNRTEKNLSEFVQRTENQTLVVSTTANSTYIQTTEHQKLHMPSADRGIWPGWTDDTTTVTSSSIANESMNILYPDELHIPIDVLRPTGQRMDTMVEPIKDQRIITTLMHSQQRVETKIVHGNVAQTRDFPYLVSLKRAVQKVTKTTKVWKNYCGGSIINSMKVLTAAHCFEMKNYDYYYHPDKLRVVAGSLTNKLLHPGHTSNTKTQQWRQIESLKLHGDFNFPMNDIALVFVDEPFEFGQPMNINYIVPAKYYTDYAGHCYAAGFGQTNKVKKEDGSVSLLYAEIDVMSRRQCNTVWEMEMKTFLCTRSIVSSVSAGDSGGPLACSNTLDPAANFGSGKLLVGIVSGRNYDKTTLYTRVSEYSTWIETNSSNMRRPVVAVIMFAVIKVIFMWFVEFLCMVPTTVSRH